MNWLQFAQDATSTNWQYGIASAVLLAVGGALLAGGRWGASALKELATVALKEFLIPLRDRWIAFLTKLEGLLEGQSKDINAIKTDMATKEDVAELCREHQACCQPPKE
jgi:hypothetical protein